MYFYSIHVLCEIMWLLEYFVFIVGFEFVMAKYIIFNIGVVSNECCSEVNLDKSTIAISTAWNDNFIARLNWKYTNCKESYRLLQSVLQLKTKDIDIILIPDATDLYQAVLNNIPNQGIILPQVLNGNTETSFTTNGTRSSNCSIPYNVNRTELSMNFDKTSFLPVNVVSVLKYLKWSRLVILFEAATEDYINQITTSLSKEGSVVTTYNIFQRSAAEIMGILKSVDNVKLTNITVVCRTSCVKKVMTSAETYVQVTQRTSVFRHCSQWLIFELIDDNGNIWEPNNAKIDNIARVPLPVYFKYEDNYSKTVASIIRKAFYVVGSNITLSSLKQKDLRNTVFKQIQREMQTCHWSPVDTLLWTKDGRKWNNVAYVDTNGKLIVDGEIFPNRKFGFNGRRLNITTLPWPPFVELRDGQYSGICFDLLKELSSSMNFTYYIGKPADNQWGAMSNNGSWTGIVGQLSRAEVDISICPLSVQAQREHVMDFTYYFYYDSTSLLLRKPDPLKAKWRTLIDPFKTELLICVCISLPVMALFLVLFERCSPYYKKQSRTESRSSLHTYQDSFWYMYGALLTQGGDHLPNSQTGRALLSSWWMFCMILMATYVGNLVAFLTVNTPNLPFNNIEEMVEQDAYKWGTLGGSVFITAFQTGNTDEFRKLWAGIVKFNKTDPEILSVNISEHFQKVQEEKYVFIADRSGIGMKAANDCDLIMPDERIIPMQLALGLPNNSAYTSLFSQKIISIHEMGLFHIWEKKRWPELDKCNENQLTSAKAITLVELQGAFFITVGGTIFGFMLLAGEQFAVYLRRRNNNLAAHIKSERVTTL